jgi:uncharacterized SAM-binding protein YcdF (DUF218 family)
MRGNDLLKAIGIVVGVYLLGFIFFVMTLPGIPLGPSHAQGIVTLTGGDTRLDAAVQLLERHRGERLLITGVNATTTKDELKHLAHGGARFDCCADMGYAAENTHGNAQEAAAWAHAHRYSSLIIVTARYHMPRSLTEFQAAMPGVRLQPYPVEPESIDMEGWWHDPQALAVLQGEYAKFLASTVITAVEGKDAALDRTAHGGEASRAS